MLNLLEHSDNLLVRKSLPVGAFEVAELLMTKNGNPKKNEDLKTRH